MVLAGTLATPAIAQDIRGTVRESGTRQPIPGAVVVLLDARGGTLGRNITDERGQYRIIVSASTAQLRFIRIGFRPTTVPVKHPLAAVDTVDVSMTALPTMLGPVAVSATACPRRDDTGPALGLLEQARASLLNNVVAREANPGRVVLLRFQRTMDGTSERIAHQAVKLDSSQHSVAPFTSARSAAEFVRDGFVKDEAGGRVFYAPDPDVLLDDAFLTGYCVRLVRPNRDHPHEIGLGFAAAKPADRRIDVDGVLWVDTTQRQLRTLEFRYVGLERSVDAADPGGRLSFRDMANGVVIIDRWSLRLPTIRVDSLYDNRDRAFIRRNRVEVQESGGEVARFEWPTGLAWDAPLGTLRLAAANHDRTPAAGTRVWLEHTDYTGRVNANGEVTIDRLLPGPYKLVVIDSALELLGITLQTPVQFQAWRDSTVRATLDVPTANDYVADRCRHDRIWIVPRRVRSAVWIIGRVIGPDSKPVSDVWGVVDAASARAEKEPHAGVQPLLASTRTGTDGIFELCPGDLQLGVPALVKVYSTKLSTLAFRMVLKDSLTVLPLIREPKAP